MSSGHKLRPRAHVLPDVSPHAVMTAEFRPMLVRYFSKRLSERAEIEDLVHEVLARLLRAPRSGSIENERSYAFQTANRVLIDWLRKRGTHHAREHESFDPETHGSEDFATDRVLTGQEELERVMALLCRLPERTRAIFVLRRLEGLRCAQIAERLGVSVSTVEKHLCIALEHLTEGLDES